MFAGIKMHQLDPQHPKVEKVLKMYPGWKGVTDLKIIIGLGFLVIAASMGTLVLI
jgi:hypothetical protein